MNFGYLRFSIIVNVSNTNSALEIYTTRKPVKRNWLGTVSVEFGAVARLALEQ